MKSGKILSILNSMRNLFLADSGKDTQPHTSNPQSWLRVEREKLSMLRSRSPSYIEGFIKVVEPPILPFFKPIDYVEVLAQIHEELESCPPYEKSKLHLLQYHVFKGLGDVMLCQRSLSSALEMATTVSDRLIFGAWLKYEKQGEEPISDLLASYGKCSQEFEKLDVNSQIHVETMETQCSCNADRLHASSPVTFKIGAEKVVCDRHKIAALSAPLHTMLYGCFDESVHEVIDFSEDGISPVGMRAVNQFSYSGSLGDLAPDVLLEIRIFANKFFCERLKDACYRKMTALVSSRQDAIDLMECALEENSPVLAASCLQMFLHDLPNCLNDERVVKILASATGRERSIMVGRASFSLYCLLSEVAMTMDSRSEVTACFLQKLVESATDCRQKQVALHWHGCVRLLRKEYGEAERLFDTAFESGHVYSIAGLARVAYCKEHKVLSYDIMSFVLSSREPLGWMYQERSLYSDGESIEDDLNMATELDPTLIYPYMFRAASLMRKRSAEAALMEINRVIGFKLTLECLELRFCFYLLLQDYKNALCDIHAILTLSPGYRMFEGRVAACLMHTLVREHVAEWTIEDCWIQLFDRWSSVDDIGSLSIIYRMLEAPDAQKGVLYFRQYLLLLRLNCPEAALRSLQLAHRYAASEHERLVYVGWILYDTGHYQEGLQKADKSISIQRSFEAFFLKAYALADSCPDPSSYANVASLLGDALKCPSDRLRKGQAWNNLGSACLDCGELDLAADCYTNALNIQHTGAHQGLARVHFLKFNRNEAHKEMTTYIENGWSNASAYEKRSEYCCDQDRAKADLRMATKLDPLRVYPYRYRAAVLMDKHEDKEAIAELTRAIAFNPHINLLHLRAAFHEHIKDTRSALRDCRAALSVDPKHPAIVALRNRVNSQEP